MIDEIFEIGLEEAQRRAVMLAARSWCNTPYRHRARIKGHGVDCGMILIEVFAEAGLIESFDPGIYTRDWYFHRNEEKYLSIMEKLTGPPIRDNTHLVEWKTEGYKPLMGDILIWRVGRTYSHSAIVTEWPYVVHASALSGIVEEISVWGTPVHKKPDVPVRHYSVWGKP